jgi:hypothetical protein
MLTDGSPDRRPPLWFAVLGAAVVAAAVVTAAVVTIGARPSSTPSASEPAASSSTIEQPTPPPPAPSAAPASTPSSTSSSTVTGMPGPDLHEASPADRDTVVAVTQRFLVGWLLPADPEQRTAALAGTATNNLIDLLAPVPPENLPTGPPPTAVEVEQISELAAVTAVVLDDGTRVQVELVNTAVGWQVINVKRAQP